MLDLKRLCGEYTMLSYLVTYAQRTREVLRRAMVDESDFTDANCRAAFAALMCAPSDDDAVLLGVARKHLPTLAADDDTSEFLGLSANFPALEHDALAFSTAAVLRENAATMQAMLAQASAGDPDLLLPAQIKAVETARAKIDAIRAAFSEAGLAADVAPGQPYTTDERLLHIPGFIDELTEFSMCTAQHPNRALSFAGALALLAHLAARKFVGPNDTYPNLYIIALADSGVGKEWPRKVNRKIAHTESIEVTVQGDISSGQGLEDALARTPALLLQMDEFDTLLNVLKDEKSNKSTTESIWKMLLSVYSSSGSTYNKRIKAESAKGGGGGEVIYSPSLSVFATAIPSKFYAALCERALDSGFIARCLVLEADTRGDFNMKAGIDCKEIPPSLARRLRHLSNLGRRFVGNFEVDPRDLTEVPLGEGAVDEVKKVVKDSDALYRTALRDGDDTAKSVWSRSLEMVQKLALLYAVSENLGTQNDFVISPAAVAWAWKFARALQRRMLEMAAAHIAANPFDEKILRVLRLVNNAGKKGIARSVLSKKGHLSAKDMDEIEATLLDRDEIAVRTLPRAANGRTAKMYIAVKGK